MRPFIGQDEYEAALFGGASEREALLRRSSLVGANISTSDMDMEDDEDEGDDAPVSRSPVKKTAKGGQQALSSTSRAITKGQIAKSQAKDVAAALSFTSRLLRRR